MLLARLFSVLFGLSLSALASSGSSPLHAFLDERERRQVAPPSPLVPPLTTTSTSSFNWWPYPPAYTSTALPTPPLATPEETDSSDTDTDSSTNDASSTSPTSTLPNASSSADSSRDSTSTSPPLITITALPPLTPPLRRPHAISAYRQPFNPLVFIPLFVLLGSAVGLVCGWYGYGFFKQKWQAKSEKRLAGPRYEGIKVEDEDDKLNREKEACFGSQDVNDEEELSEQPFLRKGVSNTWEDADAFDQTEERKTGTALSRIGLSMLHRSPILSGLLNGNARCTPDTGMSGKSMKEQSTEAVLSPNAPTVFSSVASSDEEDEGYAQARRLADRQGTLRHKSLRRRLAEKLWSPFKPGQGSIQRKSRKYNKACGKTPEMEEGALLQNNALIADRTTTPGQASLRGSKRRPINSVRGHGRAISDFSIPVNDVQTPPKVYALKDLGVTPKSVGALQTTRAYSTPLKSDNNSDFDDKYTSLPERKVRSGRRLVSARSIRRRSEILDEMDALPKFNMFSDVDRRVLPTSPPLLCSPELESALFFSSNVDSSNRLDMPSCSAPQERNNYYVPSVESPARGSPARRGPLGPRQPSKLMSKHSPSNGIDAIHSLDRAHSPVPLRRSTARSSSCSPTRNGHGSRAVTQGREVSNTAPSVATSTSPKERYEARHTALDKVDAIVGRSWSARLLQGAAPASSPTMFGAQTVRSTVNEDLRE